MNSVCNEIFSIIIIHYFDKKVMWLRNLGSLSSEFSHAHECSYFTSGLYPNPHFVLFTVNECKLKNLIENEEWRDLKALSLKNGPSLVGIILCQSCVDRLKWIGGWKFGLKRVGQKQKQNQNVKQEMLPFVWTSRW